MIEKSNNEKSKAVDSKQPGEPGALEHHDEVVIPIRQRAQPTIPPPERLPDEDESESEQPKADEPPKTAAPLTMPKKLVIQPISSDLSDIKAAASDSNEAAAPPQDKPSDDVKPDPSPAPASAPETPEQKPEPNEETEVEQDKSDDQAESPAADDSDKPNPKGEKESAVDAGEVEHEKQVQELIESKKYFVPINSVARKRSISISALMTIIIILLAVVLVDLMLDSGVILFAEKIPHTHFLSSGTQDSSK